MNLFAGLLNIIWVLTLYYPSFAQTCAAGKLDQRVIAAKKGGLANPLGRAYCTTIRTNRKGQRNIFKTFPPV